MNVEYDVEGLRKSEGGKFSMDAWEGWSWAWPNLEMTWMTWRWLFLGWPTTLIVLVMILEICRYNRMTTINGMPIQHRHLSHPQWNRPEYVYQPDIPDLGVQQGVSFMHPKRSLANPLDPYGPATQFGTPMDHDLNQEWNLRLLTIIPPSSLRQFIYRL